MIPVHDPALAQAIGRAAEPLPDLDDAAFGRCFERWSDHRLLIMGEASHGTAEFYRARAAITRHLIEHHHTRIVALEADWPDAVILNRYVRGLAAHADAAPAFQRFPRWMWRNDEISGLARWMRDWNRSRPSPQQAGFYGLDMYNMTASIRSVLKYLDRADPEAAGHARRRYGCLEPWIEHPAAYGRAVFSDGYRKCEEAVVRQCRDLLMRQMHEGATPNEDLLDAAQSARLVATAERYYRVMYYGGAEAWNLRDSHMADTLAALLEARPDAAAVVWAHNSHVGDASHTDMGRLRNEHNLGQLARARWPDRVALIGLGTYDGSVSAASDWGGPMEVKTVMPAPPESLEGHCHAARKDRFLLDLRRAPALAERLSNPLLQRFIGVIYRPETERISHYMQADAGRQYDAWLWFDRTRALTAADPVGAECSIDDTWPY